jgi:hypothetical protein
MHFDFTRPSGQWYGELVPSPADYQSLDAKQSKSIEAENGGGIYSPRKPIIIGGQGMTITNAASYAVGGVSTATGGRINTAGGTDLPVLNDRTRTITMPAVCSRVKVASGGASQLEEKYFRPLDSPFMGIAFGPLIPVEVAFPIGRRYLHNGATLQSVGMTFAIGQRPAAVPNVVPGFGLFGWDLTGTPLSFPTPDLIGNWNATTSFAAGLYAMPTPAKNAGLYFSSSGGTSGSTEPTWPTTVGATVTDGSITWTCIGRSGQMATAGVQPDGYYASGQLQTVWFDSDPNFLAANIIDAANARYAILTGSASIDPSMTITSFEFKYIRIRSLGNE